MKTASLKLFSLFLCLSILGWVEAQASSSDDEYGQQMQLLKTPLAELGDEDAKCLQKFFQESKDLLPSKAEDEAKFFKFLKTLYAFQSIDFIHYLVEELNDPSLYLFCARYYDISPLGETGVPKAQILHDDLREWKSWGRRGLQMQLRPGNTLGPRDINRARQLYALYDEKTDNIDAIRRSLELTLDLVEKAQGYETLFQKTNDSEDRERAYRAIKLSDWRYSRGSAGEEFVRLFDIVFEFSTQQKHWDYLLMFFEKNDFSGLLPDSAGVEQMNQKIFGLDAGIQQDILKIVSGPSHLRYKDEYFKDLSQKLSEQLVKTDDVAED